MDILPLTYCRAKRMRNEPTEAERKLWGGLRNRALCRFKFVRQQPIGPYIVDFVCRQEKLIVEVDGSTHGEVAEIQHDLRRTEYLQRIGYRVVRVWNADVYRNIVDVLETIVAALERR